MKKIICITAALAILISLSACGNNERAADTVTIPSDKVLREDVQAYITEILGSEAKIDMFEVKESSMQGSNYTASCMALYDSNTTLFELSYSLNDEAWELISCRVDQEESSAAPEKSGETHAKDSDPIELSDSLFDFTFTLDGVNYQLPCRYSDFTDNGWTISSSGMSEDMAVTANTYEYAKMAKAGNGITVYFINMSGNVKKLKDCKIGGIEVARNDLNDANLFVCAKGITTGSTKDEVTAAYGAGNSTNTYDEYTSIKYEKESYIEARFECYEQDTKYNSIQLRNFVAGEDDVTETSTDVPDYLAQYIAPTELGNDLTAPKVLIEGDLYSLPAPLSVFLDNGWSITQKPDSVSAGNREYIRLERNGVKLYATIINLATYQTIPENCAVCSVHVSADENVSLELPSGITFSSTKQDVENVMTEDFDYYGDGTYSDSYYYSEYQDADISISIDVSKETGIVSSLSVSCETWSYS